MPADVESALEARGDLPPHVVDGLPMPVVLTRRADDVIVRINQEYTTRYGLTDEDAAARPFRELHWVQEDRDHTLELQASGDLESFEVRIRTADGVCRWAQADVSLFEYRGETVFMTTLHDIGRTRQAEHDLATATAEIHEMARFPEMNPGPVVRLALNGTVLRANAAASAIFGLESLEGECLWDLLPDLDEAVRARVLEEGGPVRQNVQVGDTWLALTLACEAGSQQIFVYGTDISALKTAEQELSERARFPLIEVPPVAVPLPMLDLEPFALAPKLGPLGLQVFELIRVLGEGSDGGEVRRCRTVQAPMWSEVIVLLLPAPERALGVVQIDMPVLR